MKEIFLISELNLLVVCFVVVVAVENDLSERNQIHSLSFDDDDNDPTLTLYHQQHVIMMMFSCSDGDDDDNNNDCLLYTSPSPRD